MPVPVVDTTTSVLAWQRGKYYAFQPALAVGSDAATGWNLASGALPDGLSLNSTTGLISGTIDREAQGSVWTVQLRASNGSGNSTPVRLTFGVEYAEAESDGAIHAVWDLDSGMVAFRGLDQKAEDGLAIAHVKANDQFPISVQFLRRKTVIDLPVTELVIAAKRYEPEGLIDLQTDGDDLVYKDGEGETARYTIWLDLQAAEIANALADEEEDDGTAVAVLAEFQACYLVDMGEEEEREAFRTSISFWLMVHRDLI